MFKAARASGSRRFFLSINLSLEVWKLDSAGIPAVVPHRGDGGRLRAGCENRQSAIMFAAALEFPADSNCLAFYGAFKNQ